MVKKNKILRVVANPFAAIDHAEGCPDGPTCGPDCRPAGAFPHEPAPAPFQDDEVRHVGAKRHVSELSPANPMARILAEHDRAFEFSHETIAVNQSTYYRNALNQGQLGHRALLPADEATHAYAGIPGIFKHPHAIIAQRAEELGLMPPAFGELHAADCAAKGLPAPVVESPMKPWAEVLKPHQEAAAAKRKALADEHAAFLASVAVLTPEAK